MTGLYLVYSGHAVESVGQETHHDGGHYEEAAHEDAEYEESCTVCLVTGREGGGAGGVVALPWPCDGEADVVSEVRLPVVLPPHSPERAQAQTGLSLDAPDRPGPSCLAITED